MNGNSIGKNSFLVTGGAGFIGSNIVHFLVKNNAKEVRVLDDLSTGYKKNLEEISGKIRFIEADIRNPETCMKACDSVDIVLHHAALGSVPRSIANPLATNAVNVDGFVNMLHASVQKKIKRFVYASSSSVYGDDIQMPKVEERTGKLLSPYAVTKRTNEEYAKVFADVYGLQTIGLRYFNVFGPHQSVNGPYAAVIPLFINALMEGKSATIFGDGKNTRDFTFVENVVRANMCAAFADTIGTSSPVLNIAFGSTVSLNELFSVIASQLGSSLKPEYGAFRKGDIRDSWADISKAISLIGYQPVVGLNEGLKKTIDWFRSLAGK
ncbi:MAG: SDR family oxidoreductase [Bacteroidetes bacterium]|nr:SDR family oxidoreductase [Bacteroidota bacterium]